MTGWAQRVDRGLGWLGLLLIGSLSWLADHIGTERTPASSPQGRVPARPSTGATDTLVIERPELSGRRRAA